MEQLAALLQGLQSSARAQAVLTSLALILDDVLVHPQEEQHRRVRRDELTPVSARLLESCGFVDDPVAGELRLPAGADLRPLREARGDVVQLLRRAESAREGAAQAAAAAQQGSAPASGPLAAAPATAMAQQASGPLAAAPAAAMALQQAAASVSATVSMPTLLASYAGDQDVLGAASPSSVKPKSSGGGRERTQTTRTVPSSVTTAAAAVGQAVATAGPAALLAGALGGMPGGDLGAAAPKPASNPGDPRGTSRWVTAPGNTSPESRLVVSLPEAEFTYIERPWSHFVTRWAAIDMELSRRYDAWAQFSLLDLGCCCGFFSLQAAAGYASSLVIGIEGSVGIGNGTTGVSGTEDQIIATKAVQTHLRWIQRLYLPNCLLAPEVWDYRRVCQLAALGRPICDVMLLLSVVHHIDNISTQQYSAANMSHLEGTVSLMGKLLMLAHRHFVELPDRPWLEHVHSAYGTSRPFLEAAARASGRQWTFVGPLCVSEWYGTRELWLLEDAGKAPNAIPLQGLKALFPRTLDVSAMHPPSAEPAEPAEPQRYVGSSAAAAPPPAVAPEAAVRSPAPLQQQATAPLLSAAELPHSVPQRPVAAPPQPGFQKLGTADSPLTSEELGAALLAAPTALIAAHVQLRDALAGADTALQHTRGLK